MPQTQDVNFKYGFEIEQENIPQSLRNLTQRNSGVLKEYDGHIDCGHWEIGTYDPGPYAITIRQLDMLFYSRLLLGQDGLKNYKKPFKWVNRQSGCHIHVSINIESYKKKTGLTTGYVDKILRDYANLHNIMVTFNPALFLYMNFREPFRNASDQSSGVYRWAAYDNYLSSLESFKNEWLRSYHSTTHEYRSPCIRIVELNKLSKFGASNAFIQYLRNQGYRNFVTTIELRANENHYFIAGELVRRFLNFARFIIKEYRNKSSLFKIPGIMPKIDRLKERHQSTNKFRQSLFDIQDIDLGREFNYGKFKLRRKYPSWGHLVVDLTRNLMLFYMRMPSWRRQDHDMLWYIRDCLNKGMDIKVYANRPSSGAGPYEFDNHRFSQPVNYPKVKDDVEIKKILKQIRDYNR